MTTQFNPQATLSTPGPSQRIDCTDIIHCPACRNAITASRPEGASRNIGATYTQCFDVQHRWLGGFVAHIDVQGAEAKTGGRTNLMKLTTSADSVLDQCQRAAGGTRNPVDHADVDTGRRQQAGTAGLGGRYRQLDGIVLKGIGYPGNGFQAKAGEY
ncbi:MAG TPA: hypothetical protein ENJ21_07295 [Chromatiaceae bacterium]|nr:hypothetical protein [Chromatiaceae bacterium]